jgi:glycosyltransferase involved in cell wall biosynthesis
MDCKNIGVTTMAKILIYYPSNKPSNVIETIAQGFVDRGHKVYLLTQGPKGDLHHNFETNGIQTETFSIDKKNAFTYYIKHIIYLVSFCKKHNITAVQSHLQQANIIAVFAQYFTKAKVIICRHHLIEPNKVSEYFDKVINKLAKVIIVPSEVIRVKLLLEDNVKASKIKLIPYIYDFTKYPEPVIENVNKIKAQYSSKFLVLLCGRFVPLKRNDIVFMAIKKVLEENYDVTLLALDEGPGLEAMKKFVNDNHLQSNIEFLGYRKNVMDYIAACDVLVHPSFTEASNNSVKEAGIHSKNVIVCEGVGDFSEYIIHEKNGYLANKENPLEDIIKYLKIIYNSNNRNLIGQELKKTVYDKFHKSETIIKSHLQLLID